VLARGRPTLADVAEPALNAPDLAALRTRITVQEDPAMTAAYPARFAAEVSLTVGGKGLAARVADAWGDPEVPMDEAAIVTKFETLAATAVPPATANALPRAVMGIGEAGPGPLRAAFSRLT
jgi:2-methylcitrate dehydratase PrpD